MIQKYTQTIFFLIFCCSHYAFGVRVKLFFFPVVTATVCMISSEPNQLETDMSDKPEPNDKAAVATAAANITDQERDWAQQALAEYEQKNYKACLQHLERIEVSRPNDPKVRLNKAVVEFYENGLCSTDKFRKAFIDVCSQVRF